MIYVLAGVARNTNIAAASEELVFFESGIVVFDFSRLAYFSTRRSKNQKPPSQIQKIRRSWDSGRL